ncbi:efflux RND transporter periplasmic adaptor subunit [Zavarzinia compransoris]|uniref:Efflux RND transporter periplasmic adaptor subunit n=1 Tax=Zavarzinia compransoris TaxID=1264899 RepID=A0A317E1Z1_9PROT|nr:efflux RND transporter periplasmic adaptor subunit [Zavarzinia compransoris]PWR20622.1 efflux RND transporter periplasmic adaptor subunit [Zavarzinia compransoris]TDP44562.1 RND family efflux transporter MFP subunit [Zavarzinia compransoris]
MAHHPPFPALPSRRGPVLRLGLVLALVLGLAACDRPEAAQGARGPALTVTVLPVTPTALTRQIIASGTVLPWEEIVVAAEAQGLAITEVAVEEGERVSAGQILLRLNDAVLKAQSAQQEASLTSARALLAEARANLARAQDLQPRGTVSRQSLDERIAAERTAAAQVLAAEAALAETRARLDQTVVKAPAAGIIGRRSANLGQVVSTGGELFRLIRDGRLELKAEVPEATFAGLTPGLAATVTAEGIGRPVAATLRSLSPTVDSRTRLGIAHLALPADSGFRPGMFATGAIDLGTVEALMVPAAAIVWRDGIEGVFVLDAAGTAHFTPVVTGSRPKGEVEIREGLKPGDRIAVQGAGFLEEGDKVGTVEARS